MLSTPRKLKGCPQCVRGLSTTLNLFDCPQSGNYRVVHDLHIDCSQSGNYRVVPQDSSQLGHCRAVHGFERGCPRPGNCKVVRDLGVINDYEKPGFPRLGTYRVVHDWNIGSRLGMCRVSQDLGYCFLHDLWLGHWFSQC